ncbi:MAG: GLPGLI family protein [Mucilaginibacter sp.]|uniref:GLPGLI family protein n=1 Tax=Mucilaginibacter sp. TaxID=1882438 RepID=UPI003264D257
MKQQLLILLGIVLAIPAFAQKPDSTLAIVHYKFSHIRDTNARDKPYTENMVLLVGQNASVYKSYDRKMQMDAMRKDAMAQMQAGGPIKITSRGGSTSSEYFQYPNEGKMIRKESIMTTYLIDEPFPVIQWKISADTMTIRNLNCQKATGHFKGRDYTAWFCAELPYRSGPWKLSGLPGLIVEAYDTKKDVEFKFDGIEQVAKSTKPAEETAMAAPGGAHVFINGMGGGNDNPAIIALPDNGVRTTPKEFDNLREAMRKDPNAFMQSAMAGSGMNVRPGGGQITTNIRRADGPVTVINNPLELPEKK